LIASPSLARPHPYVDSSGVGWSDNDHRFLSFASAIAALVDDDRPDVLHLNDWHTAATLGFLPDPPPSVLTIHNLAYQGNASGWWLSQLPHRPEAYEWYGGTNPLTGGIALADRVVTVSPRFAAEALRPETGFGVHDALAAKRDRFTGILNGIEVDVWNPATDPHLPVTYDVETISRKRQVSKHLSRELGWEPNSEPTVGMVSRLTDQKGVDIALEVARSLPTVGARMVLLGSGDIRLAETATSLAGLIPDRFAFRPGYDEAFSHLIFGGSDLYLMPSRFEPGGLTQMQAMRYGAIPVVTDVGGLHDTVVDADVDPNQGNGFVAPEVTTEAVSESLARAVRGWKSTRRRGELRRRGMETDWSWTGPARKYLSIYTEIMSAR
jgi:starch synthase